MSQEGLQKRRFIAGAVCPRCAEMDRLVIFGRDDGTYRECISCGYTDKQPSAEEQQELSTRVNQVETVVEEDPEVVPLKFFPSPSKSSTH